MSCIAWNSARARPSTTPSRTAQRWSSRRGQTIGQSGGPLQVDAFGVHIQAQACAAVGLKRVVLVSSLCAGRWLHPLNLFGLILVWKRVGERTLQNSSLDWTVIRPGGLSEDDSRAEREGVVFSAADAQQELSIPRRLVARVCLESLNDPASVGRIIEVTSSPDQPQRRLQDWLALTTG